MKKFQKIPSGSGEAEYIEKKSRFISHVFRVETVEEANEKLAEIKKTYWDASSNCYAYVLDSDNIMRFSDDGEPQGTAGIPILDVLRKQEVYCALIVVTRYFGGTLLGAGGLVRAYGKAAAMALENGGVSVMTPFYIVKMRMAYNFLDPVRNTFSHYDIEETNVEYAADVTLTLQMPTDQFEPFNKHITELTSALVVPQIEEERLIAKKI